MSILQAERARSGARTPDLQTIWKLYSQRTSLKMGTIESFRYEIDQKAQVAHLKHDESWYKEAGLCDRLY